MKKFSIIFAALAIVCVTSSAFTTKKVFPQKIRTYWFYVIPDVDRQDYATDGIFDEFDTYVGEGDLVLDDEFCNGHAQDLVCAVQIDDDNGILISQETPGSVPDVIVFREP